uniref:Uncharacterized protein n=1 Tax=Parastrongyloides trichosuri TaxID=131310 RepID=A0A0N4Z367_PARTI
MASMKLSTLLLLALCASPFMAEEQAKKNDSASVYGGAAPLPYMNPPPFIPPPPPPMMGPPHFPTLLDDHICDEEAGVLIANFQRNLVNNAQSGGYGGNVGFGPGDGGHHHNPFHMHGNSKRFKCSDIAATNIDSCNVCCRIAPRFDRSIRRDDVFGVIVDTYQLNLPKDDVQNDGPGSGYRVKRYSNMPEQEAPPAAAPPPPDFTPEVPAKNLKCICCMPRRRSIIPPFPPHGPGHHGPGHHGPGPMPPFGPFPPQFFPPPPIYPHPFPGFQNGPPLYGQAPQQGYAQAPQQGYGQAPQQGYAQAPQQGYAQA